jgi:WD40 repeat protein/serine/threonine protein kinase
MSAGAELPPELDRLAEEFVRREREGERPTISEYVRQYPEFESGIREVFPLLAVMEGVLPTASESLTRAKPLDAHIESLGEYRLVRVIGRGGMGVVYEAEQEGLGRRVALKVLPPSAMLDPRFLERFRIEAQAAARLQHPHIVPVIGLGEDGGVHYYAMQLIQGRGLDEVLFDDHADAVPGVRRAAGEPGESGARAEHVAGIGLQCAEALAYAHAQGVLHRDVKPSNIMLDGNGEAWITDFGLCRADEAGNLTRAGDLVGTLRYMAPECFQDVYDVQCDVYGLGLTLYEMLSGAPAFEGTNRAELVRKVVHESPPPLRNVVPEIPQDLSIIVHKAMARDRSVRYPTAEALASDLRAFLEGRPISARSPTTLYLLRSAVRRHRPIAITLAVATLLLVAGAVAYMVNTKAKEAQARQEHYAANIAAAETALRDGDLPAAKRLLARAPEEFRDWEWLHLASRLDSGLRTFTSLAPDLARTLAHSPDGRWLAVGGQEAVFLYDQESGARTELDIRYARDMAWSPTSDRIAIGTLRDVVLLGWPGGRELARHPWSDFVHAVRYDRTGERLFVGGGDCRVYVLETENLQKLASVVMPSKVLSLALSPGGRRLAVGRLDGTLSLLNAATLETQWEASVSPRGLLGVTFLGADLVTGCAHDGAVRVLRASSGTLVRVLPHAREVQHVAASPDGRMLAAVERGGRLHLWDPRTGSRLEARTHGREVMTASFRADGLGVVTASLSGTLTEWGVFSNRDPHVLGGHLDGTMTVSIHPNGSMAATGGVGGILRLWDLETGELARAYPGHGGWIVSSAFSPDGQYVASGSRDSAIFIRRVSDGVVTAKLDAHTRTVRALAYTPDSKHILSAGGDGVFCAWDAASGLLLHRVVLSDKRLLALAVSRDGALVAVSGTDAAIRVLDTGSWKLRATLRGHEGSVQVVAFDPKSGTLASGAADQTIRLWDARSGKALRTLSRPNEDLGRHTDVIDSLAFHPGGSRLLSGSRNGGVTVWDWSRGQRLSTLRGHAGWVHELAFSTDGSRLVSCSSDRTARVWDTRFAAARAPAYREARKRRDLARPLVDSLYARTGDLDAVMETIRSDEGIAPDLREGALRLAHRRWCSRPELKKWMWRVLLTQDAGRERLAAARCVALGFVRVSMLRVKQDAEGLLLAGVADYRTKPGTGEYYLRRSIDMLGDRPELRAIAWAFLVMTRAADGRHAEAVDAMRELDTLVESDSSVVTHRLHPLVTVAKAVLARGASKAGG